MRVSCEGAPIRRGYEPLKAQRLEPGTAPDMKESFYIGREIASDDPRTLAGAFDCGPNRWPHLPGWRAIMENYFAEMLILGRTLYSGLALPLDLGSDYFDNLCDEPHCTLRLLRYPPQTGGADTNQRGIGAHTDFGGLTFLSQDTTGGLQIHDGTDGWIDVPPIPGAYVINLGDMIARWTNDRYRSTLHRVINQSARERYSVTFFMNGKPDHVIACLPTCLNPGETPHYPPTTVERHIRERIRQTYEKSYAAAAG
jgi:isopenicillin N synthase-like dioxygenase